MFELCFGLGVGLTVLASSIWVLIDARRLGLRGGKGGLLSNSPAVWFIGCIGIWAVAFPLYLVARAKAIAARRQGDPGASRRDGSATAAQHILANKRCLAGAPAWVGPTALAIGIASIPAAIFGVLGSPLWLSGLVLGIWGAAAGGPGRRQAIAGIAASAIGIVAMMTAILLMAMWLQGRQA